MTRINNYILNINGVDNAHKLAIEKRLVDRIDSVIIQEIGEVEFAILKNKYKFIRHSKGLRSRNYEPSLSNLFEDFTFCNVLEKVNYIELERL